MRTSYTTMVITYPNGAKQVVKPNMSLFNGAWSSLADGIAGHYFVWDGKQHPVTYELK